MNIHKKLFDAKKEIGKISKDATNPFFNSKYFDINSLIEHVEPILTKHNLLLLQPIEDNNVTTKIIDLDAKSDEVQFVCSSIQLPVFNDPQKLGSAVTYYRRYTLQSLLSLQAEDDDANKAAGKTPTKSEKPADNRPWLNEGSKEWKEIETYIANGQLTSVDQITKFKLSKKTNELLVKLIQS